MMTDHPHKLHVATEFDPDDAESSFELEHHGDCPTELVDHDEHSYLTYVCLVGEMASNEGLTTSFRHSADARRDGTEPLTPGTHLIEAWSSCYRNYTGAQEWEGGLRLIESEAAQHV